MKNFLSSSFKTILLSFLLLALLNIVGAFTEPAPGTTPPAGTTYAPIHSGPGDQVKQGQGRIGFGDSGASPTNPLIWFQNKFGTLQIQNKDGTPRFAVGQDGAAIVKGKDLYVENQGSGVKARDTDGPECHQITVNSAGKILTTPISCATDAVLGDTQEFGSFTSITGRIVFVTSTTTNGWLTYPSSSQTDGTKNADAFCQGHAQEAGLPGTYKAWISGYPRNTNNPRGEFSIAPAGVPYQLVNGTKVANDWNDLTDGTLLAPINVDEKGRTVSGYTWTFTDFNGLAGGTSFDSSGKYSRCGRDDTSSWNYNVGNLSGGSGGRGTVGSIGSQWTVTDPPTMRCDNQGRLYCFQQ